MKFDRKVQIGVSIERKEQVCGCINSHDEIMSIIRHRSDFELNYQAWPFSCSLLKPSIMMGDTDW